MLFTAALAGFFSSAGLIIAIGAQNAFILKQGLQRRYVSLVVIVAMFSDIVLIMSGVAGMGILISEWSVLMQVLRFGGAAFLGIYGLMAAWRAFKGSYMLVSDRGHDDTGWVKVLLACLAFTFLNPHAYIDTTVLLGSLSTHYIGAARWAFGIGACLASIVWFTGLGYGARFLQPVFKNPVAWRVLDGLIAIFMLCLSVMMLTHSIH